MAGDDAAASGSGKWWVLVAGIAAILIAVGYYLVFLHDDRADSSFQTTTVIAKPLTAAAELNTYYAATGARLRDRPTITGSSITGRVARGEAVSGSVVDGSEAGQLWLQLADAKGYVNLVNLSENPAPQLRRSFGEKKFELADAAALLASPGRNGAVMARLAKGQTLTTSGITDNGFAEIILNQGGVGYIADGERAIAAATTPDLPPSIVVKLDNNGCGTGPEIDKLFRQIQSRQTASQKAVEDAKYADDDAREAAIEKYMQRIAGKSIVLPLNRSFRGLTVTGVAQHLESQSVYFAEPPEQVRSVFRSIGYRVGKDGKLPSGEIYASIDASPRSNPHFGKTDLGCGV
jgi:hypothetical protein